MNVRELAASLAAARVPASWYAIYARRPGSGDVYAVVGSDHLSDQGGMILSPNPDGRWQVDIRERGTERVDATFASEDEACRWFHDELIKMAS